MNEQGTPEGALKRSPSSELQIPPEILYQIFLRAIPPSFLLDPWQLTSQFAWCMTQRQKRSIVGVCRTWYSVGITLLYEDICIRRVEQLVCLRNTLRGASHSLGSLIKTLNVGCMIKGQVDVDFSELLQDVFDLCPALSTFSFTSVWSLPFPDTILPLPCLITHLNLENPTLTYETMIGALSQTAHNLISLWLHVPEHWLEPAPSNHHFIFPRLKSFCCRISENTQLMLSNVISPNWTMDCLCQLTLIGEGFWDERAPMLTPFFISHGKGLKYLSIDTTICSASNAFCPIAPLLTHCPVLEHLVLGRLGSCAHPNVKWLDQWNDALANSGTQSQLGLEEWVQKFAMPSLQGIRFLSTYGTYRYISDFPIMVPPATVTGNFESFAINAFDKKLIHEYKTVKIEGQRGMIGCG
ncbi:hypothetical protein B0H34DRAFT_857042 [Crassisporium funariophilum]|nr:hypothetical protein B0H34DRAFT_857042 [Crassisporium funariophilum]